MGNGPAVVESGDTVLEIECEERDGTVVRAVKFVPLTIERLRFYYDNLKEFDVLFNEHVRNDFKSWISQFLSQDESGNVTSNGLIWQVDDVGIFYLTDIRPGYEALAHFNFWDQKFNGRRELCREMLKYIFTRFGFHRIVTEVAMYATKSLSAVEWIGFTKEGRKREAVKYKGEWWDVALYSILEDEV